MHCINCSKIHGNKKVLLERLNYMNGLSRSNSEINVVVGMSGGVDSSVAAYNKD